MPTVSDRLLNAARFGNIAEVERLLSVPSQRLKVDAEDMSGETALMHAAANGHEDVCVSLLQGGADVNHRSFDGSTALLLGSTFGRDNVVNILLNHGADVDAADRFGETPLMVSAARGYTNIMSQLLEGGCRVNRTAAAGGSTALLRAAERGKVAAVELLLQNRSSVELAAKNGDTPLVAAARKGHADVCSALLLAGADPTRAMSGAVTGLQEDILRLLLKSGAAVDGAVDGDGNTPLMIAASIGAAAIAHVLLEAGADCRLKNRSGSDAIFCAKEAGQLDLAAAIEMHAAEVRAAKTPSEVLRDVLVSHASADVAFAAAATAALVGVAALSLKIARKGARPSAVPRGARTPAARLEGGSTAGDFFGGRSGARILDAVDLIVTLML